ncbi:MAG TPA: protein translocase subunit SecF [Gammaproteobacteria bacterium]|nr:protein translocase subunit SecF [Gammaproteobacteria bacterium]
MKFFPHKPNIDFMGKRHLWLAISGLMVAAAVVGLFARGLNFGIDFTGGILVEVGYPAAVKLDPIRTDLNRAGFGDAVVQYYGNTKDILIRLAPRHGATSDKIGNEVTSALQQSNRKVQLRRVEFVGPQVGSQLVEQGALAVLYTIIGILIYVAVRFEWRFSVGAVLALIHDVTITMGFFAWSQLNFDLTALAAVLTILGYSLNDTIVVYDRIRENFRNLRRAGPYEVVNASTNQTLSRTVMTSLMTLVVVVVLAIAGGQTIHPFSLALIVGIVVGTYSSIYIASTFALMLGATRQNLISQPKEKAQDGRP